MKIKTIEDLKEALRQGKYSSVGSYPLFFLASDGEALSWDSVRENIRECFDAIKRQDRTGGWLIVEQDVNWEDPSMFCAHSGERIESAYAEDIA
jgi:hypothetical protein